MKKKILKTVFCGGVLLTALLAVYWFHSKNQAEKIIQPILSGFRSGQWKKRDAAVQERWPDFLGQDLGSA